MQMSTNEQATIKIYEAICHVNSLTSTAYEWTGSCQDNVLTAEEQTALDKVMKNLADAYSYTLDVMRSLSRRSLDLID